MPEPHLSPTDNKTASGPSAKRNIRDRDPSSEEATASRQIICYCTHRRLFSDGTQTPPECKRRRSSTPPSRPKRQALPSTDQRECERPSRLAPRGAPVQAFAGADGHTHPSSAALPLCLHPPRCRASSSSRKAPRRASVPPTPPPRCWAASAPCPRARAWISGTAATASSACWRTGSATGAAACTSGTARCWPPSSRPRPRPRTMTMTTMAMAATGGSTTTAL